MIDEQNQFPVTDLQHSINSNSLPGENVTQPWGKRKVVVPEWGPEKCPCYIGIAFMCRGSNMVTPNLKSVVRNPLTLISDDSLLRVT